MNKPFDCLYEERVAIMIHDGGLTETDAKDRAWKCVHHRTETYQKKDGTTVFNHTLICPDAPKKAAPQAAEPEDFGQMSFEQFSALARSRFHYE